MQTLQWGVPTRARLHAGNAAADKCCVNRNARSTACAFLGWPQTYTTEMQILCWDRNFCRGNENEISLMYCPAEAREPNWWLSFPGCTGAYQCLSQANLKHKDMTGAS